MILLIANFGKLFSLETKVRWYDKISKIGNNKTSKFISCNCHLFGYIKILYPNDMFKKIIQWDFEGKKFPLMEQYDSYMRVTYGDYMKLPSEDKRIPEHKFKNTK